MGYETYGWVLLLGDWSGFEQVFPTLAVAIVGKHMYAVFTRWGVVLHAVSTGDGGPRIALLIMKHEVICSGVEPNSSAARSADGYPMIDFRFPYFCGNAQVYRRISLADGTPLRHLDGGAYDPNLTQRPAAREAFEHELRMKPAQFTPSHARAYFAQLWCRSAEADWRLGLMGILTDPLHVTLLSDDNPVSPTTTASEQTARIQNALRDLDVQVAAQGGSGHEVSEAIWGDKDTATWFYKLGCVKEAKPKPERCIVC